MLLKKLNQEEIKSFIKIVAEFIAVDSNLSVEENTVIERYLNEFSLVKKTIDEISKEDAIKTLMNADNRSKRIVYFELLGIALIDGEYETSEVDYLEHLANEFGITRSDKIIFANYYFDYENIVKLSNEERDNRLNTIFA